MPICYFVGGLGESVLRRTADDGGGTVWPELSVMMLGKLGEMRLAPNGTDPGPPDGVPLLVAGQVAPYCGLPSQIVAAQLALQGYGARLIGWDWRRTIYTAGQALAATIRAEVTAADPCAIVGHSAGGLLARAAWSDLGTTGQQNLVRRIVTLGTPHWGSYSVVTFFQGDNSTIDLLNFANQTLGASTYGFAPGVFGYVRRESVFYQQLAESWPGLYDVLPVLGAPDAVTDPQRPLLYDAANWPAAFRPQQIWLDYARTVTGPWLRSAGSVPPPHVLTCCSGLGRDSPSAIVSAAGFRQGGGLGLDAQGDGTVTAEASELAGAVIERYPLNHENWLPTLANSGDVARMVLEVRSPGPAPAPQTIPQQQTTQLPPMPGAEVPLPAAAPAGQCRAGNCPCHV